MLVKDIMQTKVIWINTEKSVGEAFSMFKKHRIFTLPVVDKNYNLIGLLTKTQLLDVLENNISTSICVENIMIKNVITVWPETTIATVGSLIRSKGIGRFPVVNSRGQLVGIITKTDVLSAIAQETEKMLMETNIILNSADDGVIAIDLDGKIRLINAAAESMLHIPHGTSIGRNLSKIMPDFMTLEVLETGVSQLTKGYQVGSTILVINSSPVFLDGRLIGAVSVLQDITRLEAIAFELEEVKKLKETLLTLVENPYEAAIVVNDKGIIELMNNTFCDFLNVQKEDVIGKPVKSVVPDSKLMEVIETGTPQLAELWKIKDQEVVVMRVPIVKDGKVIGAIGKSLFADLSLAKEFAKKLHKIEDELAYFKSEYHKTQASKYTINNFIGQSEKVKSLKQQIIKAAKTTSTVLITGESGTGKEVISHAIHRASPRKNAPFVKVNCAGIPEQLLESELFGYLEGSFTGAKKGGRLGKFQVANKGTIFLDEIGDMPLAMQAKLLRVLQEKEVEPIGSSKAEKVDVRVIAATNRNLEQLIEDGSFRLDLYYRLNVVTLLTPPLRERIVDIPELCAYLIKKLNVQLGSKIEGISKDALQVLMQYHWPGNIRELQNLLERAINLTDQTILGVSSFNYLLNDVPNETNINDLSSEIIKPFDVAVAEAEKSAILKALEHTKNNRNQAAKVLQIHRSKLYRKLEEYNIT